MQGEKRERVINTKKLGVMGGEPILHFHFLKLNAINLVSIFRAKIKNETVARKENCWDDDI